MYEYLCRDNYFGFHHKHAPAFLNTVNAIIILHLGNLTGFVIDLETEHKCDKLANDQHCVRSQLLTPFIYRGGGSDTLAQACHLA